MPEGHALDIAFHKILNFSLHFGKIIGLKGLIIICMYFLKVEGLYPCPSALDACDLRNNPAQILFKEITYVLKFKELLTHEFNKIYLVVQLI